MPLWLDLMRTPMAAPETALLRRMRRIWQALCVSAGVSILALQPLKAALVRTAPALILVLIVACFVLGTVYFLIKQRADEAWLNRDDA
ncbi:putative membrane protein [Sphingomonas zeicaulis]|uniref:hypothetical protein n=1 Tax=Sphingomonas zeicaulis TaxID=1632740 RepID=UPI003D1FFE52